MSQSKKTTKKPKPVTVETIRKPVIIHEMGLTHYLEQKAFKQEMRTFSEVGFILKDGNANEVLHFENVPYDYELTLSEWCDALETLKIKQEYYDDVLFSQKVEPHYFNDGFLSLGHRGAIFLFAPDFALDMWNAMPVKILANTSYIDDIHEKNVNTALKLFGERAIPKLIELSKHKSTIYFPLLKDVESDDICLRALACLNKRSIADDALNYLVRYPETTLRNILPIILGKAHKLKNNAIEVLKHIQTHHKQNDIEQLIEETAKCYGDEFYDAWLGFNSTDVVQKAPDLPNWLTLESLPTLLPKEDTSSNKTQTKADVADVVTSLMMSRNNIPHEKVTALSTIYSNYSLQRFVIAIFDKWIQTSCRKDLWAFYAMGWFTGRDTMRKLSKTIRYWTQHGNPSLALNAIEILAKYATETKDDMGLVYLNNIATQTGLKYKFREPARQHVVEVAHARRLTKNELQDRLVPSFELNERGQKLLDYGTRQFTVKLDETLMPYVVDADNVRLKSIPRLNKKDDQEKATQAKTWYKNFKKDIQKIANQQIKRLEHAMCSGQTWSFKEFEQFFVKHPLMTTLSQRVIWHFSTKQGKQCFRIAEDLSFLDINDDEIETGLIENQRISIVHPLLLDDTELGNWGNVLTDYEIMQPFDQLNRQCFTFHEEELASNKITRFAKQSYYAGSLLALLSRGWENKTDMEKFMVGSTYIIGFTKRVAGMIAEITLTTGFHRDDLKGSDPQTIASVSFGDTKLANLQKIYPIQVSELLRDISLIQTDSN